MKPFTVLAALSAGALLAALLDAAPARSESAPAAPATPTASEDTASYDVGLMIGSQLGSNGLAPHLSRQALQRGLDEALAGKFPSDEQQQTAQQFMRTARAELGERNTAAAREFLARNAQQQGIQTLPSGLQYRVLATGDARASAPGARDQVTIRYRASLPDGTEFDRSDSHAGPATFRLNSVIAGWRDALVAMRPGDRWQVFVPPALAYGNNPPPPIPPGSLLIYELELLRVEAARPLSPETVRPRRDAESGGAHGTVQSPAATSREPDGSPNPTR